MHLKSPLIGLLIVCLAIELPSPTDAQFWLKLPEQNWEREMLATRDSGVCYKEEIVETINPNARLRQISYCCEGYVNHGSPRNLRCQPICTEDCANGLCLSPGYCECAPGYYREERRCKRM